MDFYKIVVREMKDGTLQVRPDWKVGRSEDLMTRGGSFYAVWDEERGLWSKDIYDVQRLVDADLHRHAEELAKKTKMVYNVAPLQANSTKLWDEFIRFVRNSGNNSHNLDEKLIFADTKVKKEDYASIRLPYALAEGDCPAWDAIVGTLYNEEERAKIEWAIGAVVTGHSKSIQKFLVFYGPPGSGKSTILNIVEMLFPGYTAVFDARELAGNNNAFATSAFKTNPLVAIQHDGDLSRIYDNTKLNSIVAHEIMIVNEKYKATFESRSNAFLFMGTNVPVRISDAKSGIIRRLIDVVPTQKTIENELYHKLMEQVRGELGAIAWKCMKRYRSMGKNHYSTYRPTEMMLQTDVFYNYVDSCFDIFRDDDGVTLKRAWALYKEYCAETGIEKMLPQYKFREELKNYFYKFEERARVDGVSVRSYYSGFKYLESMTPVPELPIKPDGLYEIVMQDGPSIFDDLCRGYPAQYANEHGSPSKYWTNTPIVDGEQVTVPDSKVCHTVLGDLDTSQLHFVKLPENHIVIDFDLVDEDGNKDFEFNLREASRWPATYAEISKSGSGIHLHYIYTGDVHELASVYDVGIEIKTLLGNQSLRRKLTQSNGMNITPLAGGLPTKEKPLLSNKSIQTEKGLRDLIGRNLRKEFHAGTKPSVDFILKILDEAYEKGMQYDLSDMRPVILAFAARSTNQKEASLKAVQKMKFVGQNPMPEMSTDDSKLAFFDVEVYPNLFVVCWKYEGSDQIVKMVNPSPSDVEELFKLKLVGFNNRRYDNHILYARYLGWSLEDLFKLSQKVITDPKGRNALFGEAYNLSYTDIFDYMADKTSLKKLMIKLDIHHMELDLPWDQPVPEELWEKVVDYCVNDVIGTEAVHEAFKQDFVGRQILAELSGLSVNHTTQQHTAKIIFGEDKDPQRQFVYLDLAESFPGYKYDGKESTYRGEITGEGGYVYAEPGVYENVGVLDVASMHPTSIKMLNLFGPYTEKFNELVEARLAIKKKDYDKAATLLDGKLEPFLTRPHEGYDIDGANKLAYALKIIINSVYGLTSARFPNVFKDERNIDNIVAKRGALFMIDLKHEVQARGYNVVHIKTDSIKIPEATQEIIDFVTEFGKIYGYDFEFEGFYDYLCLVNQAVYIAQRNGEWTAIGAQFAHPYIFKKLLSHEDIKFSDFCETKSVTKGTMYLDFSGTGEMDKMVHVGRVGSFVPVVDGGGTLLRIDGDKIHAVTGTKGYSWIQRPVALERENAGTLQIDMSYFDDLERKAVDALTQFDQVTGLEGVLALPPRKE